MSMYKRKPCQVYAEAICARKEETASREHCAERPARNEAATDDVRRLRQSSK